MRGYGGAVLERRFQPVEPRLEIGQRQRVLRAADMYERALQQCARGWQIAHVVLRGEQTIHREDQPRLGGGFCLLEIARHGILGTI
ncbi:hypothetical protein SDC9_200667 [bioreactor metagenome]|uniref:Uncharacterized protein n=1 Tax=bioreactor metagenome TaxID=1076179 RepID=A0A645IX96_9ZZZZ